MKTLRKILGFIPKAIHYYFCFSIDSLIEFPCIILPGSHEETMEWFSEWFYETSYSDLPWFTKQHFCVQIFSFIDRLWVILLFYNIYHLLRLNFWTSVPCPLLFLLFSLSFPFLARTFSFFLHQQRRNIPPPSKNDLSAQ